MTPSNPDKPLAVPASQRGAIAVLAALVLGMLMVCVTLALDVGRLMMEKRRLQQNADLAAMAAAQQYCDGAASEAAAANTAKSNLRDNGFDPDNPQNTVTVSLGSVSGAPGNTSQRIFTRNGYGQAIRVELTRTVPAALFSRAGNVTLQAQATAQRNLVGVLSVGSQLVNVNTSDAALLNPLLGKMLGIPLAISAVGYNGLVQADIQLQKLRDAMISAEVLPTGASVQDIAGKTPSLGTLLSVMANAANGTAAASTLLSIKGTLSGAAASQPVNLGSILTIDTSLNPNDGQSGSINSMALLMASAMAVNTGKVLDIGLNVGTSGLTALLGSTLNTTLSLGVIAPPTIAIGKFGRNEEGQYTEAKTSQLKLSLQLALSLPPSGGLLGALVGSLARVTGNIGIGVEAAQGKAWLDQITSCPSKMSSHFNYVIKAQPEAAHLRIGNQNLSQPGNIKIEVLLGLVKLQADIGADIPLGNSAPTTIAGTVDLSNPNALPTTPVTVTTNLKDALNTGLNAATQSLVVNIRPEIAGQGTDVSLGGVLGDVLGLLTPLLTQIAGDVLQPLLAMLGVQLGTVDVSLLAAEPGQGALLL